MRFIEEVVVEEFLPTFRSMLAEELRERGLTQHEVAETLGISQSAVSKYAHGEINRREEVLSDERVADLVERIADGLTTGDMTSVQALVEAEVLVRRLEEGDLLARLHEQAMPELAEYDGYGRIHDPESALRTSEQVRSSVRRALRRLTNTSGFAGLIPNVGSNLVECLPEAATVDDVAGVPGRIFDVKGRATVPGDPEFGVSEHVASVLLSARDAGRDVRAAINVRYDPEIVATLEAAGYDAVEFDPDAPTDPIRESLADREDLPETFVCYQTGGYGIEPITYVLGPDADAVVAAVKELLRG
ncbi:thiamine-phosphate synthase family protein [Halobellus marinus]|jgi:predicted fused transcriptional regulator/phosphomethylpyrimidine kinase/predicted transcriptional regulator|uniref:thiamine-phosphate synthase family protein n=1 Tax=Halobellus TaxID=1073986 RepID=UPI0028A86D71|nr:thiamine-phosphate synthase family protein [Halobellus sp. DFY28]